MEFEGRVQHRRLFQLGADGREPGAGACRPAPTARRISPATARAIHTHGPVSGAFRGFGVPQAALWQETLYDRLADKAGIDRLEFRLANALRDGDADAPPARCCGRVGIVDCLTALQPHWARALAERCKASRAARRRRRLLLVWLRQHGAAEPLDHPHRPVAREGEVVLHQGATDIGQGSNTVIAQIAAEALGLPLSAFGLIGPDTALTPDAGKTSASRQTFVTGPRGQGGGRGAAGRDPAAGQCGRGRAAHADGARAWSREGDGARGSTLPRCPPDAHRLRAVGRGNLRPADHRRSTRTGRARPMPSMATARRWWNSRWTRPWARSGS